ncbi:FAD:protein FMN transferase [bacterium]|jgi:FAD:protein FMN transferase|nr:FAD:protein FMN transferase [bacterium]MBT4124578.1 FAD:protein FMN transferase [Candidatus Paceibacterota bacterium]MBT4250972.1 FAD:protein FMN transferase [bacterium]MBT4597840.1 FAD:protein FMN transferase [bacterium]MBT6753968.1 FAD:protein FMN transferase [bacterium]
MRIDKPSKKNNIEDYFGAMGTDISLEINLDKKISKKRESELKQEVRDIFTRNEGIFSRFQRDSELSKMNRKLGVKTEASQAMIEVLLLCEKFNQISKGYFDPRVLENLKKIGYKKDFRKNYPTATAKGTELCKVTGKLADDLRIFPNERKILIKKEVDTTGIVKGYTIDLVKKFLFDKGIENFIIDAGGDMFAQGLNSRNSKWKIGIEGLEDNSMMLAISGMGIATSGISRKRWTIGGKTFHHLINPKKPNEFACDLKTVTVIDEKAVEADGRAKSLFLMGKERGLKFANEHKIKALFLDYKGNIYVSEKIKKHVL